MNSKMRTNSQLSKTEPKKQTKQTTRTGTESQKWRFTRRVISGEGKGKMRGEGTGNKKHKL